MEINTTKLFIGLGTSSFLYFNAKRLRKKYIKEAQNPETSEETKKALLERHIPRLWIPMGAGIGGLFAGSIMLLREIIDLLKYIFKTLF